MTSILERYEIALTRLSELTPQTVTHRHNKERSSSAKSLTRESRRAYRRTEYSIASNLALTAVEWIDKVEPQHINDVTRLARAAKHLQKLAVKMPNGERITIDDRKAQWLYDLKDENAQGYKSTDGGRSAATTLYIDAYPRDIGEAMIRRCKALGHKHIVLCARTGKDAKVTFNVDGHYDWLTHPEKADWIFSLCDELDLGIFLLGLDDDDTTYNADWATVSAGWRKLLDRHKDHRCLSSFLTGIEVEEAWNGNLDLTIRHQKQRIGWLKSNYPDLVIGLHLGADKVAWECGQRFTYYQIDAENHGKDGKPDGTLRTKDQIKDEFSDHRRAGEAKAAGVILMLGESAHSTISAKWLRENHVAGALEGLAASDLPAASGMG